MAATAVMAVLEEEEEPVAGRARLPAAMVGMEVSAAVAAPIPDPATTPGRVALSVVTRTITVGAVAPASAVPSLTTAEH